MKFLCPHCSQRLACEDELAGATIQCPSCNAKLAVPSLPARPQPGPAAGEPPGEIREPSRLGDRRLRLPGVPEPTAIRPPGQISPASRAPATARKGLLEEPEGTNVNLLISGLWALGLTVLFYLILMPFKGSYLYSLFYERKWIPYIEAFLMWWSIVFLIFKSRKVVRQKRCMLFDLLPDDIGRDITASNVDQFMTHIQNLPAKPHESYLIARVLRGLEHFRVRNSNPEVATVVSLQSDIDANTMQASYTLVKVFIWAIPILGFIGTVQGLGSAVGGFSAGLDAAADIAALKNSLTNITVGLAVAFDTTLIALVMSVILMFPMSSMQKSEEDLLSKIDDYCNEHLLKRLKENEFGPVAPGTGATAGTPEAIRAELQMWGAKLETIGASITRQVTDGWQTLQNAWLAQRTEEVNRMRAALAEIGEKHLGILRELNQAQTQISTQQRKQVEDFKLGADDLQARAEAVVAIQQYAESLRQYFGNLEGGLKELDGLVKSLNEKGVQLQSQPRKRWWNFSQRKNG